MLKFLKYACASMAIAIALILLTLWITSKSLYVVENAAPIWSPNGKTLLFFARTLNLFHGDDTSSKNSELYKVNIDGTGLTQLTHDPRTSPGSPKWSPNGERIVFIATDNDPAESSDFYLMKPDGSGLTQIQNPYGYAQWSSDGHQFVFHPMPRALVNGVLSPNGKRLATISKQGLVSLNINDSDWVQLTNNPKDRILFWSPDSKRILYASYFYNSSSHSSSDTYWIRNANGSEKPLQLASPEKTYTEPSWSPNGQQILYEKYDRSSDSVILWIANADGSDKPRKLKPGWGAVWSPNGQKIAFICQLGDETRSICVVKADGSVLVSLKQTTQMLAWSPNSQKIAFVELGSEPYRLSTINADGSGLKRLTHQK
jgi:Tol biopolymer transport system component